MQQLKEHLSRSNVWSVEHEGIWLDFCLQSLTGGLYEDRASLIRQVQHIDITPCSGTCP